MRAAPTHAQLETLAERITQATGLAFPTDRMDDLASGIAAASQELGFTDAAAAASALVSRQVSREQAEILARHLTIGETYFFRGKRFMDVLRGSILPMVIQRHAADRRLRIWSAGCASGEEPYTVAMILDQMIKDRASWDIRILATDINRRLLEKGTPGVYGRWSFRGCPAALRRKYFRSCGDSREEIMPEIRRMVTFSFHNLAADEFPRALDIIICKNVLMYLSAETRHRVLQGFRDSLMPGGFLFVSPTEASMPQEAGFIPVMTGSPVAFVVGSVLPAEKEEAVSPLCETGTVPNEPIAPSVRAPARRRIAGRRETPDVLLSRARSLADRGDLEQALHQCRAAIAADKSRAASHLLEGMILEEMGRLDEAASSMRRSLYLDPDSVIAHFSLGILARKRGRIVLSERYFRNVVHLLAPFADGDPIPGSDGLTAAALRQLVRGYARVPADEALAGSRP